ncbi:testis-expressed protein 12 isoform X2 [Mixophyes fleayi]|uniref:testis-expressed protein 12 isoform X2 n=1 Tax=Mixophyes fleayi TaxID=3061075 RepID=UPI003F4DAA28
MANSSLKCESKSKGLKRKIDMEILDSEILQCSSPTSQPSAVSDISQVGDIEAVMKDLSKEINLLFCNYAKTLRSNWLFGGKTRRQQLELVAPHPWKRSNELTNDQQTTGTS